MAPLSDRDKALLAIILVVAILSGVWYLAITPIREATAAVNNEIATVEGKVDNIDSLNQRISNLTTSDMKLSEKLKAQATSNSRTINKQEFVLFLTNKCKDNQVELTRFDDLGTVNDGKGVWRSTYDFQVRASHADILKICSEIDALGIDYNVTSISLRQNLQLSWTERASDNSTRLPWYIDSEKSKEEENAKKIKDEQDRIRQEEIKKAEDKARKEQEAAIKDAQATQRQEASNKENSTYEEPDLNNIIKDVYEESNDVISNSDGILDDSIVNEVDISSRLNQILGLNKPKENKPQESKPQASKPSTSTSSASKPSSSSSSSSSVSTKPETKPIIIDEDDIVIPEIKINADGKAEAVQPQLDTSEYYDGTMLCNITIQFIMYTDPADGTNYSAASMEKPVEQEVQTADVIENVEADLPKKNNIKAN